MFTDTINEDESKRNIIKVILNAFQQIQFDIILFTLIKSNKVIIIYSKFTIRYFLLLFKVDVYSREEF